MELGIYHEFPVLPGRSQAECFAAGFDIVDASEEYGLDVMWLAELHFDKRRALAASPLSRRQRPARRMGCLLLKSFPAPLRASLDGSTPVFPTIGHLNSLS